MIVTAGRSATVLRDVPQQVELITSEQLQQTPSSFMVDVLKKNASVDVIQYPGGLSGIGMRGFRPQFSGINQQVLVLLDGRPAGITSIGNLPQANIARVEVVKGSSSSVYGASAMGGVVNFITRQSEGPVRGGLSLRGGSFETFRGDLTLGGSLTDRVDFDLGIEERSQYDDFDLGGDRREVNDLVLGDGATRPFTSFQTRSGFARLGVELSDGWRADLRVNGFVGDVRTPGGESDGTSNQGENDTDVLTFDARLQGQVGAHDLLLVAHRSAEDRARRDAVDGQVLLSGTGTETELWGLQFRDAWRLSDRYTLVGGVDFERFDVTASRLDADGDRIGAFSPDEERTTVGAYLDLTGRWLDGRLLLNGGVRADRIESRLEATLLRPDFVPGSSEFDTVNPRAGVVFYPGDAQRFRLHASVGRGFVVPRVRETAGATDVVVGGQRRISRGNPDLDPESAVTLDLGLGYEGNHWGGDLTWFRTDVDDKIESIFLVNTSELRESTTVNASSALAQGLEAAFDGDLSALFSLPFSGLRLTSSATYYLDREQDLPDGVAPLRNVARFKINGSLAFESPRWGARLAARHVVGMIDRDFSRDRIFTDGAGGAFTYADITVVDLDARYYLTERQTLGLQVENLLDEYYFEKNDFPMQGRMVLATYRVSF